jgi:fatty acid amide hydrolase
LDRKSKRNERAARFASLHPKYHAPFSAQDKEILQKPIADLVQEVQNRSISALDILCTYGKVAVKAQQKTNCVTELLLPEAERWAQADVDLKGPLAGIPVSLKDSIQVNGFDVSLGYTYFANKPYQEDGSMVRLLKKAGTFVLTE